MPPTTLEGAAVTTPTDNRLRIALGGSWGVSSSIFVRAAYIGGGTPTVPSKYFGFRTAQTGCRQPLKG